jgi:hypothetical protein
VESLGSAEESQKQQHESTLTTLRSDAIAAGVAKMKHFLTCLRNPQNR